MEISSFKSQQSFAIAKIIWEFVDPALEVNVDVVVRLSLPPLIRLFRRDELLFLSRNSLQRWLCCQHRAQEVLLKWPKSSRKKTIQS